MGGGWQAGRARPILDDATRGTMGERSDWKRLLDAPLPPLQVLFLPGRPWLRPVHVADEMTQETDLQP